MFFPSRERNSSSMSTLERKLEHVEHPQLSHQNPALNIEHKHELSTSLFFANQYVVFCDFDLLALWATLAQDPALFKLIEDRISNTDSEYGRLLL